MHIREYRQEDEESWLRCRVLSFLHTAYYDNVLQNKETCENPSIELVSVHHGQVVGLIDVECETEPSTVCTKCTSGGGMIWHLAVHPDFQRMGIGTRLLTQAESMLKNMGIFELEAWTRDDDWVNNWYVKHGFRQVDDYLHVFMEGKALAETVHSTIPDLEPSVLFAHYTGNNRKQIKKSFHRVHECRCYYKSLS